MSNAKLGAAVLGGYLLGRTKKGKLALSLGAALAGSRIRPGQVGKLFQDSPFLGHLSKQVRTELADAGKAATTAVLTAKADNLADALHERTEGLHAKAGGTGPAAADEQDEGGGSTGEGRRRESNERGREDEPRKRRHPAARSGSRRSDDG